MYTVGELCRVGGMQVDKIVNKSYVVGGQNQTNRKKEAGRWQASYFSTGGWNSPRHSSSSSSGGKAPRGRAQARWRVGWKTGKIPPALHIAHENVACRMTRANATAQGYYRPSEQQKAFRWRPGTRTLHEIHLYQKSTVLLLWQVPFLRLIREVAQDFKMNFCFMAETAYVLQVASKDYLVCLCI